MPRPGRMTTERAKDFKGTLLQLVRTLGRYRLSLVTAIVFAILSTIFNIAGPKVLAKATTALATGWVAKLRGTGSIDFVYIAAFNRWRKHALKRRDIIRNSLHIILRFEIVRLDCERCAVYEILLRPAASRERSNTNCKCEYQKNKSCFFQNCTLNYFLVNMMPIVPGPACAPMTGPTGCCQMVALGAISLIFSARMSEISLLSASTSVIGALSMSQ